MTASSSSAPSVRFPWWRVMWLGCAVVAGLAVVFHRPLFHWSLHRVGTMAAARAGWTADWTSSGSVFRDLVFERVTVTGGEAAVVRSLSLEHGSLEYDLGAWRTVGVGGVLERLVVRRLEAEIDLTRPAAKVTVPRRSQPSAAGLPSVRMPVLEIEQVSLRFLHPGGVVEVEDFALSVDPLRPGRISVARVSAPGLPELRGASGLTRAGPTSLVIEQLALWPDTSLESLVLELAGLEAGQVGVKARVRQGEAEARVEGVVGQLPVGMTVDVVARADRVSNRTLAFWGVPDGGLAWNGGEVELQVSGPVRRPAELVGGVTVRGGRLAAAGGPEATVDLRGRLAEGVFTLDDGRATLGQSAVVVRGTASVPAAWSALPLAAGELSFDATAPAVEELWAGEAVEGRAGVRGGVTGRGSLAFAGGGLTEVRASVAGAGVEVMGLPVEALTVEVSSSDGRRWAARAEAELNEGNRLRATGGIELSGEQRMEAAWQVDCRDLATVPTRVREGWPWPTAGTLASSGTATGTLAAARRGDWTGFTASASLEAAGLRLRDAVATRARVRASAAAGQLEVGELSLELGGANKLTGTAKARLDDPLATFSATLRGDLPALERLSGWSTDFGGPAVRGGQAAMEWDARGGDGGGPVEGGGFLRMQGLRVDGVAEPLGGRVEVVQSGRLFSMEKGLLTAGPWRAEGSARWDGVRLVVPGLTGWVQAESVGVLTASVPMAAGEQGVSPLGPPDQTLSIQLAVDGLDLQRLGAALGRSLPVTGRLRGQVGVSGTLSALAGGGQVEVVDIFPSGRERLSPEPARVTVTAELAGGRLEVQARAMHALWQPLTVEVRVPVDGLALMQNPSGAMDLPLSGRVRLPESSLAFLSGYVTALRSVQGSAAVDAVLGGTVGRPGWSGVATVRASEVVMRGVSFPSVRDLRVRIRSDARRVVIEEAAVMLAGGRLRLEGGVDLARLSDPELDLRLRADEVLVVRDDTLSLRADAELACRGRVSQAAVTGSIDLVRGRVFKEVEFLPLSLPNQLPPPPPPTTLARSGPPALPPPFDRWTVAVAVRTRDPIRLMGNVARGNVVADLRLTGTGARPVLIGSASLRQMWVKLPFSRLNITRGEILFREEQPFDPQINVVGESITDGRVVEVAVEGRALAPSVRLTSSPPLPEGEIATLLATGVTTSDLVSRSDEAAGRAAFVMMQQAYRRMFPSSSRSSFDDEPPRLSFEFSLFGSDPARRGVSALYELNPRWRVIGRVGETGTFRGLLHYLIRFR